MRGKLTSWVFNDYKRLVIVTPKKIKQFPMHTILLLFTAQRLFTTRRSLPKITLKRKLIVLPVLDTKEPLYTALNLQ